MKFNALFSALMVATVAAWQPAEASITATLTPTARVDTDTTTRITYTLSAAADVGTQDVTWYFFRVVLTGLPLGNSTTGNVTSFNIAPSGSPWAITPSGPFTSSSSLPTFTQLRWQGIGNGQVQTLDTFGGVVGSFDFVWNRPASGQYDAGFAASAISSSYINRPSDPNNVNFVVNGTPSSVGIGVSTLITAVPEPTTSVLMLGGLLLTAAAARRRLRGRQPARPERHAA